MSQDIWELVGKNDSCYTDNIKSAGYNSFSAFAAFAFAACGNIICSHKVYYKGGLS